MVAAPHEEVSGGVAPEPDAERLAEPLPPAVRARLLALVADALSGVEPDELPSSVRAVARFVPARRARAGAGPLGAALDVDAGFRQRMADRVAHALPGLRDLLRAGAAPGAADPLDVAALAYLDRPPGWTALVSPALVDAERDADRKPEAGPVQVEETGGRAGSEARSRQRAELERVKAENATLRQRMAELRRRSSSAEDAAAEAAAALRTSADRRAAAEQAADSELRRLRSRVGELEEQLGSVRRSEREGRTRATVSQRILLDAVLDAAAGLRRELALPPVSTVPGDGPLPGDVVARATAPAGGEPVTDRPRALDPEDLEAVDAVLALPGLHLIVDGYNVTRLGWDALPLEAQRRRLVGELGALAARTRAEVSVVFDGADLVAPPVLSAPRGVRVLFSPADTTADEVVRRLVGAEPEGRPVLVVSTDREVVDGVRRRGARTLGAAGFLRRLSAR